MEVNFEYLVWSSSRWNEYVWVYGFQNSQLWFKVNKGLFKNTTLEYFITSLQSKEPVWDAYFMFRDHDKKNIPWEYSERLEILDTNMCSLRFKWGKQQILQQFPSL